MFRSGFVSSIRWWWVRLLFLIGSLFIAVILGELILSIPSVTTRTLPPAFVTSCRDLWSRENYDRLWENNPDGFRSFHLEHPKKKGKIRIITLGDSFTWGDKIASMKNIWPYVLERACLKKGIPVEVVNLAKCGFTTVNEAEMLERFGWPLEPDLILLQFFLNDPLPSSPNFQSKGEDWMQPQTWPLLPFLHQILNRKSYLYSWMNHKFSEVQKKLLHLKELQYPDLFRDDFLGWQESCSAIQKMKSSTMKRKIPMLIVIFPSFQGNVDDFSYPYLVLHEKVKWVANENQLPVLDLRSSYAALNPKGSFWWALSVDPHPSVEAHRVAGERMMDELQKLNLLRKK